MSQERSIKPEVSKVSMQPGGKNSEPENGNVEERAFTEEQDSNQLKVNEEDFIHGLIDAAGYAAEEKQLIEIIRDKKLLFAFNIRPLSESEYAECKKKATKYVRNRNLGVKMPEDTDNTKYRSSLIYEATVDEDKEKLWDNKKVWEALRNKDFQVVCATDVIEYSLKAGEKERVVDCIDKISGYEDNLEEVVKN